MSDYISCVEAHGGNKEETHIVIQNIIEDVVSGQAGGSGSGPLTKGKGQLTLGIAQEDRVIEKIRTRWFPGGSDNCASITDKASNPSRPGPITPAPIKKVGRQQPAAPGNTLTRGEKVGNGIPGENCTDFRNGTCYECQYVMDFMGAKTGDRFPRTCSLMPKNSSIEVMFSGFITADAYDTDNKVWNVWISAQIDLIDNECRNDPSSEYTCADSRSSPGLGTGKDVTINRLWKRFKLGGTKKLQDRTASAALVISHCQISAHPATCDAAPPGTGTNYQASDLPNRGFPGQHPPEPAVLTFRVKP
jgi:hypothetical protein